jgi:hypothetical protein
MAVGFPPYVMVDIQTLACDLPATSGAPGTLALLGR